MLLVEFPFDPFDGFTGFNRGGAGKAADHRPACLCAILEVAIGFGKRFFQHAGIIAGI